MKGVSNTDNFYVVLKYAEIVREEMTTMRKNQ